MLHKQYLLNDSYGILQTDIVRLAGLSEYLVVALMNENTKKKKICLHAGGVGLCNMAAQVCILDYVLLGSDLRGRYTEYIDHLQEHFEDDLVVKNARYLAPACVGFGLRMKKESLDKWSYPNGTYWSSTDELRTRFYGAHLPRTVDEEQRSVMRFGLACAAVGALCATAMWMAVGRRR